MIRGKGDGWGCLLCFETFIRVPAEGDDIGKRRWIGRSYPSFLIF